MPDADKIGKLSRRWSKIYKEVCEGYFDSFSLASDAMIPLKKDIENYGNYPIRFLREASNRLESIRNNPLFLPVHDWNDVNHFIRDLASTYLQKHRPNQRGLNIAVSACKDLVHKIRNAEEIPGNLEDVLIRGYIRGVYDSSFGDLSPLMLEDHMDVDREEIRRRLDEIGIFVDENIDFLASQIPRNGNVKRLRSKSRSTRPKIISIKDDVFSLGNRK